ncbi:Spy/CpxP family protein refolding chaperone [Hoeflea prorocentri]|uniref:Periplasmic heavy metal sensor n=1 Tax=Hoeflea prorocentri TaxID=1922333 RepID=A0A9X3UJV6_9HYPH|nr:Spy/CpxP family protein refolding chaperone [Hoeflea prorocentri]MCY6381740.1 periplasmic heavy metal sensor [Hoeflea prorocentri]MDA5399540.1 periplasmic heavy metal sensor [Hoeflea prorocentri]
MSDNQQAPNDKRTKKANRIAIAVIVGAGVAAGGIFGVQAVAQTKTYGHIKLMTADRGDMQEISWGGHRRGRFANMTNAEIEEKITRAVKHLAIEIDATQEQQDKIVALVTPAAINMKTVRTEMRGTGWEFGSLLTADDVDPQAIEELRAEKLAEADEISKEWVNVITEVAMVLTPEQRETLRDHVENFRSKRGGWWRH